MECGKGGDEMTCSNTTALPKERRHRGRFRLSARAIVALVVGFGILVLIGLHYRAHLLWRFEESRLGLQGVQATPDRPMPKTPTPNGWTRCRVGCIEFSLPPELAANRVDPKNGTSFVTFQHGSRIVGVELPMELDKVSLALLKVADDLCPQPQRFTMPRLRLACYQTSSDDFCWSMTSDEVRWHAFRIMTDKLIRPTFDGHTESLLRNDLDGILHFLGNRGVFSWQCNDCMYGGWMHLVDSGEKLDPGWIRAVCQSIKRVETETQLAIGEKP